MTEEELQAIRDSRAVIAEHPNGRMLTARYVRHVDALLAEVERLQVALINAEAKAEDASAFYLTMEAQRNGLAIENAAMREIVRAVATGETCYVQSADRWVLAFDNPTLSHAQTIWHNARDLVASWQAESEEGEH